MSEKILITGTVGVCLPPPYAGVPKLTLLVARLWKAAGVEVAVTFNEKKENADDLGAGAQYYFEFQKEHPSKFDKLVFVLRYFSKNPLLYIKLFKAYNNLDSRISREVFLYSAYGIFIDEVVRDFKPTKILCEAAYIKGFMAMQVGKKWNIPVIFDTYAEVHDDTMWVNKRMSGEQRDYFWSKFLNEIDLIIAPSHYCAKGPLRYVDRSKVKVLYPGIDIALANSPEIGSKRSAREYFKLPQNSFLVTAVGSFAPRKGHDQIIQALAVARKHNDKIYAVLCGPGPQDTWRKLAEQEGVADAVYFFTGLSELELYRLYRACDVYCDASNTPRACLGMSLTEGMLMELPAIVYDNGGLPEVVHDEENGYVIEMNNIDALAMAINKMANLPDEDRVAFGRRGKEMALELVDLELMAIKKMQLLKSCVVQGVDEKKS